MSSSSPDLSTKGRSLLHKVTNKSSLPLILAADLHESGRWWTVPPATIPPAGGIATYSSCNRDGGILTGTTGAVAYRVAHTDFYIALFFSNPYVGAFKAGAKVYRGLPSTAQLKTDYASNDVVLVKQGTTVFGSIHVGFAPAVDRDSPATYTFDIQGDSLSGVPLESLVPPADSDHQPKRQHPLAVPRSIDPPFSLRLLSYNLFLRPLLVADSTTFASNDYKESRTELFIQRAFEQYDVLCLHEVFDNSLRTTLKQAAKRWDINYCLEGPASGGASAPISSGLLVLSRFPILEPHAEMFAHAVGADAFSAKGFVSCKLLLPQGGTINLVSTHLQANPSNVPGHVHIPLTAEAATVRYSQLIELASALRQRPHLTDAGLVFVGDLNIPGGSDEYTRMVSLFRAVLGPNTQWIDLFADAGMAKHTWKPWSAVAHPTNLVDVTMTSLATGTTPGEVARHEHAAPAVEGARLDYAVYIKTGKPVHDSEVPMFHLQHEPFVVEGDRKESEMFEKLSDHDALCIYMA